MGKEVYGTMADWKKVYGTMDHRVSQYETYMKLNREHFQLQSDYAALKEKCARMEWVLKIIKSPGHKDFCVKTRNTGGHIKCTTCLAEEALADPKEEPKP